MTALPSLKRTVPLLLLAFAGILSAVDVLYHIPRAERTATNRARERLFQDLSRLQGRVEYLVLKGDLEGARREVTVLRSNPEYEIALLLDDTGLVIAATRRAFLGQPAQKAVAMFNAGLAQQASRERRAYMVMSADGNSLFGYTGVLAPRMREELRPSRLGLIFIAYDLGPSRAEARAQILMPSLYRATLVGALALVFWCIFHFVLTRRAERLVVAAERLAAGDLGARAGLSGRDELARLGQAFDTMAVKVAGAQTLLRVDIEKRERTEAALRVSEESYRTIFEASEDAILIHEIPSGRFVDMNPRASSAYGYTREEMLAIDVGTASSGQPPYTQEEAMKLIARAIAGEQLRFEWHSRNRDGSLHWDEVLLKRVVIGGHDRVLAVTRDITDRREAALRESEARYHLVAQQTGHLLYDHQIPSGAIRWAGPIADLTGYTDEEFQELGMGGWEALIHPEDRERAVAEHKRAQSERRKYLVEYRLRRKDGRYIYIEDEGAFLAYGTGAAECMLGTLKDITARKGAEEALHRAKEEADAANEAKSRFLAHMSHELRTPLNAILGYAQILERDTTLSGSQRNGVTVMHRSGEHLLGLINDILDVSKVEFQKLELQPHDFSLRDFLEGIAATFAVRAREKGLRYRQSSDPNLPPYVHGDEQRLRQVLFNLIGNAVKFTDHGEVVCTVEALGPRLCFTVEDTGRGVPPEEIEQIFQAFHQVADQARAQEGAGLGLPISRGIVERMGGTVEVASTPGQGSRFWFDIPLPEAAAPKRAPPTAPGILVGYLGPRRRILVVDDVAEGRALLTDILEPLGFLIAEAENGQEAVRVAEGSHPDAILMDLRMPLMDGYEATRRIRAITELREVVIIGVSASAFGHHKDRCLEAGANDFLPKPFPEHQIFDLLARHLGLEWRYTLGASAPEASALVLPPSTVLERLLALAERGDIQSLLDEAHTLEPDYPPFAEELRALAQGFQVKRIVRWLEGHGAQRLSSLDRLGGSEG